jgi:hypothetical protein
LPSRIHEDTAHETGGHGQKMRPVLPVHPPDVDQAQIRLVHERRGLEAVPGALPGHAALRDPMELPLDQRDEARQRLCVATPPRQEQTR